MHYPFIVRTLILWSGLYNIYPFYYLGQSKLYFRSLLVWNFFFNGLSFRTVGPIFKLQTQMSHRSSQTRVSSYPIHHQVWVVISMTWHRKSEQPSFLDKSSHYVNAELVISRRSNCIIHEIIFAILKISWIFYHLVFCMYCAIHGIAMLCVHSMLLFIKCM